MLEKVTIITPLHNRLNFVGRQLNYTKNYGCQRIVVDSSKENNTSKFDSDNLNYYHFQNCNYYEKIAFCLERVKTPYVIHLPDDDLVEKKGILRGVEFLEKNSSYVGVMGKQARLLEEANSLNFSYRRKYFLLSRLLDPIANLLPTSLKISLKALYSIEYNHQLFRVEFLRDLYSIWVQNPDFQPGFIYEKVMELFVHMEKSGIKTINELMIIRSDARMLNSNPSLLSSFDMESKIDYNIYKRIHKIINLIGDRLKLRDIEKFYQIRLNRNNFIIWNKITNLVEKINLLINYYYDVEKTSFKIK